MRIRINGTSREIETGLTVAGLVAGLELGPGRIAVAVNGAVVPGSRHDTHRLAEGDEVEIIHAVAGG